MDTLTQWFTVLGTLFDSLLQQTEFGAVTIGTLAAISITQVIKGLVIQYAPVNGGRGLWYSVTALIGVIVTTINWPTMLGFSWGLAVGGLFAPSLYLIGTRTLYKFWPDAEQMISATPRE